MLSVRDLTMTYGNRNVFRNLGLNLAPGEIIHLSGSNGTGKSSLLAAICGLRPFRSGQISLRIDGVERSNFKAHLSYLPAEANGLCPKRTALPQLKLWNELQGQTKSEPELLHELSEWGLKNPWVIRNLNVESYSTGMKRRLSLAGLCLSPATLWLLDEPLYGLDSQGVSHFKTKLRHFVTHKGGMVLMVTHDLEALKDLPYQSLALESFI